MAQRAAAILAACLMVAGSVSLTVCRLLCAAHAVQPAHHAEQHSCATSAATVSIAGVPHACGHNDSADVAVVQAGDIPLMPAVTSFIAWWPASGHVSPGASRLTSAEYSPPGPSGKATQLRV